MYKPLITEGSKKFGNNRWISYSFKLNRAVYLFSDLEYENWLLVESDPKIVDFCEQALLMEGVVNGKLQKSIIDMWIKYANGIEAFLEVKYSSDLSKEKAINQIEIQKNWCDHHGFEHHVRTEEYIRANQLLLSNLKLLMKGNKLQKHQVETDEFQIIKILREASPKKMSISTLITKTQIPINRLLLSLGKMIFQGVIASDIALKHYGKSTEVWIDAKKAF